VQIIYARCQRIRATVIKLYLAGTTMATTDAASSSLTPAAAATTTTSTHRQHAPCSAAMIKVDYEPGSFVALLLREYD